MQKRLGGIFIMRKCLSCGKKSNYVLCENCNKSKSVENVCNKLIKYPYEEIEGILEEIALELANPRNIKLALFTLAEYFQGDKRIYYKIMAIAKETRIERGSFKAFYIMAIPLISSKELTLEEKEHVSALLINTYQSDYRYDEIEKFIEKFVKRENITWNLSYALGEYYTFTRRYDRAKEILKEAILRSSNEKVKNNLIEKLEDCIKRQCGEKKEYLPASNEAREEYKKFLSSINIEIILPIKQTRNPNEISKENYPTAIETKNTKFNKFISFDLETTGFLKYDEIIEIGAVKVVDGKVVERFDTLVKTARKISKEVTEITGITTEMVANAPLMEEVLQKFMDFIGDDILLGHNVMKFDSKFLLRAGRKNGIRINNPFFDVMNYAKRVNMSKNIFNRVNLEELCKKLGVTNEEAHRALSDAEATAKVFFELLKFEGKNENHETIDSILEDMDTWL